MCFQHAFLIIFTRYYYHVSFSNTLINWHLPWLDTRNNTCTTVHVLIISNCEAANFMRQLTCMCLHTDLNQLYKMELYTIRGYFLHCRHIVQKNGTHSARTIHTVYISCKGICLIIMLHVEMAVCLHWLKWPAFTTRKQDSMYRYVRYAWFSFNLGTPEALNPEFSLFPAYTIGTFRQVSVNCLGNNRYATTLTG